MTDSLEKIVAEIRSRVGDEGQWADRLVALAPPDAIRAAEVVAWARNTQGGLQVCYMQKEPPRDAPWDRDSGESWTPLYTTPPSGATK